MEQYSKYKDSGIKWIGEIPEHWECVMLKRFVPFVKTGSTPKGVNEEYFEGEGLSWFTPSDFTNEMFLTNAEKHLSEKGTQLIKSFPPETVLMIGIGGTMGKISLSKVECSFNQQINALITNKLVNKEYLVYYLRSKRLDIFNTAKYTTLPILNQQETKRIYGILPPLSEQHSIVAFLEKATANIDAYIKQTEQEINTLNELKQAEIAQVVTKGLNPDAPMKDSGIAWIGEIPEHWQCNQLRKYLKLVSIKNKPNEQLLSVTREQGVIVRNVESKEENHNFIPEDLSGYKYVKKGQFAINKMKSWQGSYGVSNFNGIVSPAYFVCDLNYINKDFFSLAIRSKAYVGFFTQMSKGIRVDQWDLSPIALKQIPFFEPPTTEQQQIVEYIELKVAKIEEYISIIKSEIERMQEYKQRLISDVVTGKMKV